MKQQASELLQLDDCSQFLARYNRVIQGLDACYNNLELLTADAEDRLSKYYSCHFLYAQNIFWAFTYHRIEKNIQI